jgi:CubicO group peptidase (beta-lactamase class C family)
MNVMEKTSLDIAIHMKNILDDAVRSGRERGLQLTAYLNGRLLLDVCSGTANPTTETPVTPHTLFPVFSVTKALIVTAVHQFVQRGLIEYETPIARVWPEFAAHGKQAITLAHVLSHMAGLPLMPLGLTPEDICDWPAMCRRIADLPPQWPPGSRFVYHAMTHGWILGEVLRRLDGRSFPQILQEDICRPLGIASEMFCGIPLSAEPRVAVLEEIFAPGKEPPGADDGVPRPVPAVIEPLHRFMNRGDARRACIPASNGIMTARSLARFYASFTPGGVDGASLLPPSRVAIATQPQSPVPTDPQAPPSSMSLGYFLGNDTDELLRGSATFGHPGYGGSVGFYDPKHRLAVGFTKNRFSPQGAGGFILTTLREATKTDVKQKIS